LLTVQVLALSKDGDGPAFAVPTLDFLERFCHNWQNSSEYTSKPGSAEPATAKKYLEFLKVLFWSSKESAPVVDSSLLCTLLALSGAADTAVARAAREAVRCVLAGRFLPNVFELLPEVFSNVLG
jgi:hypothetical protein